MAISLPLDANREKTLGATSSSDGTTPIAVWVDPTTHRLLTDASVTISANSTVDLNKIAGTTTSVNNGAVDAGTLRVTVASDSTGQIKLAAGANVVGHVILDTTSTTAVTQATGTNLHAVIDTGSTTAVTQATGTNLHAVIDTGSTTAVTQATASNLNATVVGTGTFATQATLQTQTDTTMVGGINVKEINAVAPLMGNGVTGTGSLRVTLASDGTAISTAGYISVKLDQTTPGTTNAMALAQIGSTTVVTGGVNGTLAVGGNVATNVAIGTNPVNTGGQGVSSENSAVTTGRMVQFVADLVGKQIVMPYANPENFVSGAITSAMTGTTSTSLIGSPGGSLRNYITQITVSNSHATVGTDVLVQDGNGGTTLYVIPAAAAYGGASITFPVPLRQPTTATAIYVANVTTGSSIKVSASGYKGL